MSSQEFFCQNAIESAQHDQDLVTQQVLSEKKTFVERIQQIFQNIDVNESGYVTIQEFTNHLKDESVCAYFDSLGLDTSDAWTLFKLMDRDEGNEIDVDEFLSGCLRLKGAARGLDMAALSYEHKLLMRRLGHFMIKTEKSLQVLTSAAATRSPSRRASAPTGPAKTISFSERGDRPLEAGASEAGYPADPQKLSDTLESEML